MPFSMRYLYAGIFLLLGPALSIGGMMLHGYSLIEMGIPVWGWAAIGLGIFSLSVIGIVIKWDQEHRQAAPPSSAERILMPQDVRLEFDDSTDYKRKLRIEVRIESQGDVIVYAGRWISKTGDIPTLPLPHPGTHPWQIEGAGRELYEVHSLPGQMLTTWIGLQMSAEKHDVRRRTVTKRLGTLVVPLRVDRRSIPDQRIEL